jgi:hypothetical protein
MKSILKSDLKKVVIKTIIVSTLMIFFLMLGFKKIRAFFPPPEIANEKLVGFAQYFGYPFYFDSIVFLLVVLLPILMLFIFSFKKLTK